jgi:hypothetical protein
MQEYKKQKQKPQQYNKDEVKDYLNYPLMDCIAAVSFGITSNASPTIP